MGLISSVTSLYIASFMHVLIFKSKCDMFQRDERYLFIYQEAVTNVVDEYPQILYTVGMDILVS